MALSNEDKKDVAGSFGAKMANKVAKVTHDKGKSYSSKKKELAGKMGSIAHIQKERKRQGYAPKKFDRATKGMYEFFDKYDK